MKTIKIRKSHDFSSNSKVIVHIGSNQIHIKGFGSFAIDIEPNQEFYASHQWTSSNVISFNNVTENNTYSIKPRLGKLLALITLIVFVICTTFFLVTKFRWSYVLLLPIIIYVLMYLTILKNRYLIISPDKTI